MYSTFTYGYVVYEYISAMKGVPREDDCRREGRLVHDAGVVPRNGAEGVGRHESRDARNSRRTPVRRTASGASKPEQCVQTRATRTREAREAHAGAGAERVGCALAAPAQVLHNRVQCAARCSARALPLGVPANVRPEASASAVFAQLRLESLE